MAWSLSQGLRAADNPGTPPADFTDALGRGLSATRLLREYGHGPVDKDPAFPYDILARHLKLDPALDPAEAERYPVHKYANAAVRNADGFCRVGDDELEPGEWTMLDLLSPRLQGAEKEVSYEPARKAALKGPDSLQGVPCASFGKLRTLDRREIATCPRPIWAIPPPAAVAVGVCQRTDLPPSIVRKMKPQRYIGVHMTALEEFVAYAENRLVEVNGVIALLETTSSTGARRAGINVDTTAETLIDFQRQNGELTGLIERYWGAHPTLLELSHKPI